ncbi:MAG: flagellar basal-body rod protein FlgF [Firmicutes bacterium]|nr:flagellar basal-body rod protein FlgF [Bacillota bacterium]
MLRSLYSGVSGLKGNQTKMDVIGNNIANVNTTAFKSGRVLFKDMLSQTISSGQKPVSDGKGGINPKQVGLGTTVGSIDTLMEGGALQPTGRDLDLAIENEGFFVVSPDDNGDTKRYTRDGAFKFDSDGNLVNSSGLHVLDDGGSPIKLTLGDYESISIDGNGNINTLESDGTTDTPAKIGLATFENAEGLEKLGGNLYNKSNNSGEPEDVIVGDDGFGGVIRPGFLEMSNVDLANEFTEMITTSRAYQANSRTITTSDEMLQELINLKR